MADERLTDERLSVLISDWSSAAGYTGEADDQDVAIALAEVKELRFVVKHQRCIVDAIFETLNTWRQRATRLPEGSSGHRPWIVTAGDIEQLKQWAEELDALALAGPLNAPHQYVWKEPTP